MKLFSPVIGIAIAGLLFCISSEVIHAEELAPKNLGFSYALPKGWKRENKIVEGGNVVELTNSKLKSATIGLQTIFDTSSKNSSLTSASELLEKDPVWEKYERKNIQRNVVMINGIKGLHQKFDLYRDNKKIGYSEIIVATRKNVSYTFAYAANIREKNRVMKDFRTVINSMRVTDYERMTKKFTNSEAGASFEYPALWPNPIFEKSGSGKIITDTRPKWTIIVLTACYDCELPIGFPIFIQKFDLEKFSLSEMLLADKAETLFEKSEKNLKTIKAKGMIEGADRNVYYLVRKNDFLRMYTQDPNTDNLEILLKNIQF